MRARNESELFEDVADEEGWTEHTQVCVLLDYIENQKNLEAFEDFLSCRREIEEGNQVGSQTVEESLDEGKEQAKRQAEAQLSSIQELIRALQTAEKDGEVPNPLGYYDGEAPGEDDYVDEETIREIIWEDPLSVQVRSVWHAPGWDEDAPAEYCIMLCWGGPAVRIVGDLNEYAEPSSACLEYQAWFTPWIDYPLTSDQESDLVTYVQQFYLEE